MRQNLDGGHLPEFGRENSLRWSLRVFHLAVMCMILTVACCSALSRERPYTPKSLPTDILYSEFVVYRYRIPSGGTNFGLQLGASR